MGRALGIPELLQIIFQNSDDSVRATAARVNRTWSHTALDVLWYKLTRLSPLLRLLGELEINEDNELVRMLYCTTTLCFLIRKL